MWRRTLSAAGLALALTAAAQAQRGAPIAGYLVLRVNLAATTGGTPSATPGDPSGAYPAPPGETEGSSGGPPPGFAPPGYSAPGGPPGYPAPGDQTSGTQAPKDLTKSVAVVIHYKNVAAGRVYPKNHASQANPDGMLRIVTDFGAPFLYVDKKTVEMYSLPATFNPDRYVKAQFAVWSKAKDPQAGMQLVSDALHAGLVSEAFRYAEMTVASVDARKDQTQPAPVTKFVAAFKAIAPKVTTPGIDTGEAEKWREKLQGVAVEQGGHYSLVTWGDQSVGRETVKRRLDLLDENFKAFFLWHALSGVTLEVPERKLVAIYADGANVLPRLRDALDGLPIIADAFFSPVHQVLVLSPERMDDVGRNFNRYVETKYRTGWQREELLKGVGPLLQKGETVLPVMEAMTLSLIDKAVEEASAEAMITREGIRQLYSACNLLPKHVLLPEWVDHGVSNLHYKPKGPIYSNETSKTPTMTIGLNAGYGAPNYVLSRAFKQMYAKSELNPNTTELLTNTLTDAYFDAAREGKDIDPKPAISPKKAGIAAGATNGAGGAGGPPGYGPPGGASPPGYPSPMGGGFPSGGYGPPPGSSADMSQPGYPGGQPSGPAPANDPAKEKRELQAKLDTKAQATAWALVYYASKRKMPQLIKFYADLGRMPRDMRLDRQAVVRTFCAAFGMADDKSPDGYDKAAFAQFAKEWVEYIRSTRESGYDLKMEQPPDPSKNLNQGFPGGFPMDGGAGFPGSPGAMP